MQEGQKVDDGRVRYGERTKEIRGLRERFESLAVMKAWMLLMFLGLNLLFASQVVWANIGVCWLRDMSSAVNMQFVWSDHSPGVPSILEST